MTASTRAPLDFRQEHGVETPEHVEVRLELAGVGSRAAAWSIDFVVWSVASLAINLGMRWLLAFRAESAVAGWAAALLLIVNSFLLFGYFAVSEALTGGRTVGKHALGIRTVMDTGKRVTLTAAVVRAVLLIIDAFFLFIGLVLIAVNRSNKRLGDLAAGTIVVRDRPNEWSPFADLESDTEPEPVEDGPPLLTSDEFRLLDQFLARADALDPVIRTRMEHDLVRRFEERVPRRDLRADAYLAELLIEEQRRRRGKFATRSRTGAGAAGRTTITAERFVTRRRAVWAAFDTLAKQVERRGLGALPPDEIPRFAARYREVTADLAR